LECAGWLQLAFVVNCEISLLQVGVFVAASVQVANLNLDLVRVGGELRLGLIRRSRDPNFIGPDGVGRAPLGTARGGGPSERQGEQAPGGSAPQPLPPKFSQEVPSVQYIRSWQFPVLAASSQKKSFGL